MKVNGWMIKQLEKEIYTYRLTTYDGEWKNDKQNGYDVETWNDESSYMVFINDLMVHLIKGILRKYYKWKRKIYMRK